MIAFHKAKRQIRIHRTSLFGETLPFLNHYIMVCLGLIELGLTESLRLGSQHPLYQC